MSTQKKSLLFRFLIGFVILVGLDQWTKKLIVTYLKGNPPFVIWNGIFEFYYSENRGAAFGMLQGRQGFFFLIAAAVILAVLWAVYRMPAGKRYLPLMCSLFLLVSGAVGNMIDRLTQKYVVDFLYFKLIDFPIFNVADCYVVIATFSLILLFFFFYSDEELEFLSFKGAKKESGR